MDEYPFSDLPMFIQKVYNSGVEVDIALRRECANHHHQKSIELVTLLSELDIAYNQDSLFIRGGNNASPNGESLLYLLDIFFEYKEITGFKLGGKESP